VARVGGQESCIHGLVGRPDGKRSLGRSRPRWEGYMKMDLQGMEWGRGMD
jgi:hypothetical protein